VPSDSHLSLDDVIKIYREREARTHLTPSLVGANHKKARHRDRGNSSQEHNSMDDLASASAEGNSIKLRHYCRNPRCRSKLKQPVENPRRAFCTRGCHSSFYHSRCLVCERPFARRTSRQEICKKGTCRSAFRGRRIVAGALSDAAFRCATIPLNPELVARLTRQHKQYYRAAAKGQVGPTDTPVNILGGFKFTNAPEIELGHQLSNVGQLVASPADASLDIPPFLRRPNGAP